MKPRSQLPLFCCLAVLAVFLLCLLPAGRAFAASDTPTLTPPIAKWVPFEATLPSGEVKTFLVLPSEYPDRFVLISSDFKKGDLPAWHLVPAGKVDPNPTPTPIPPNPSPTPTPPTPASGMHVLVVYETKDLAKLPATQVQVIASQAVRAYLDKHCEKDGATPAYRFFDQNVDLSKEPKDWQETFKRPRSSLPWIIVATSKAFYEGPLPTTEAATLELLKKYGGE
jgi:hypothetical protein